ncbi:YceI family protein [Zhongshania guokunii]|uniref:YceI family protein n=1 Tax=Zhongshania guokunii TaxID=641783 RepID=A0ABV3U5Z3_9GAMM
MKQLMYVLVLCLQLSALNAMELKADSSVLNFVAVKNDAFAETMSFSSLSGSIDDKTGKAEIQVGLNSVVSGVDIRNERMRKFLFETDKFPVANYHAQVDLASLAAMAAGEQKAVKLLGELQMHGVNAPVNFDVLVTKRGDGAYHVATVSPGFIDAQRFGLVAGVGKLRSLAGLNNIDLIVPVTFSVIFE